MECRWPDVAKVQLSKTEVDRNPALFFFGKAVGIDARKCCHKGGVSVVNVSCGANDNVHIH